MIKKYFTAITAAMLTAIISTTAMAGTAGWQHNDTGWWWQNTDGSYPAKKWLWLDGNTDGTAECYYFGADGYLLTDTTTPDGSKVNSAGAWVVNSTVQSKPTVQSSGQIYLYGESHAQSKILNKESELWNQYYHKDGMRHLFIEMPYYTAEYLNLWMKSDNDEILEAVYQDWEGSLSYNPVIKEFYKQIKLSCPETIFHGTDVGHQYFSTGERFLALLKEKQMEDTEQYRLTQEAIEQGRYYQEHSDAIYRENKMAENFIREFDKLNGEHIMGIYGAAHTGLESADFSGTIPCMANQLNGRYGGRIKSESLTWIIKDDEPAPLRTDTITINRKNYTASYFGKQDLTGFKDFESREFWRLENAYSDFSDCPKTGNILPYDNYPTLVKDGQVFVIGYNMTDGTVTREYYLSTGQLWQERPATVEITIEIN